MIESLAPPKNKIGLARYMGLLFAIPVAILLLAMIGLAIYASNENMLNSTQVLGFASMFVGLALIVISVYLSSFSIVYACPKYLRSPYTLISSHSLFWFVAYKLGWALTICIRLRGFKLKAFSFDWATYLILCFLIIYSIPFVLLLKKHLSKCDVIAA